MVLYHVAYLEVFIGNQIARCDKRICRLPGKIFTLSTYLQVLSSKSLPCFLSISRFFLFLGESSLETPETIFRLPIVSWVLDGITERISQEHFESYINTNLTACRDMFNFPVCFDGKLNIVAISMSYNTNTLDIFDREC